MTDDEAELLERASQGDLEAFAEFVRRSERRVRGVLGRLLDDERDVEEAAQDTFVQAWRHLGRYRREAAPSTWLYRIAVNEALQRLRRKQLPSDSLETITPADEHQLAATSPVVESQAEEREALRFLSEAVRALPADSRVPLVLRDIEGWSYEEIASLLGISVAAAKSRIHRARLELGKRFTAWSASQPEA